MLLQRSCASCIEPAAANGNDMNATTLNLAILYVYYRAFALRGAELESIIAARSTTHYEAASVVNPARACILPVDSQAEVMSFEGPISFAPSPLFTFQASPLLGFSPCGSDSETAG